MKATVVQVHGVDQTPTAEIAVLYILPEELPRSGDFLHITVGGHSYGRIVKRVVWRYEERTLCHSDLVYREKLIARGEKLNPPLYIKEVEIIVE